MKIKTRFFFLSVLTLLGVALVSSGNSEAADVARLTQLFHKTYKTHYEVRFCGKNMGRLIEKAIRQKIDLRGAKLLRIKSPDFWEVQTFSARGYERGYRRMFYVHFVLEADGLIFDYDFTNSPRVAKFEDYILEMYTPKGPIDVQYKFERAFRDIFELTFYDAENYIRNGQSVDGIQKTEILLSDYIDVEKIIKKAKP